MGILLVLRYSLVDGSGLVVFDEQLRCLSAFSHPSPKSVATAHIALEHDFPKDIMSLIPPSFLFFVALHWSSMQEG